MKKIVYFILFITFISKSNISLAIDIELNTETNIKKAVLVEDYLIKHKEKIDNFIKNYDIKDNINLYNDIKQIDESIKSLKKIQNTDIEKKKAEEVLQVVLEKIKNINDDLKIKLKNGKDEFEKKLSLKKQVYALLGKKISDKIYNINLKIARNIIKDNENLSIKELQIKDNLINLNKESQKLKNFGDLNFNSESDIKEAFINILRNIKLEINLMNQELNN